MTRWKERCFKVICLAMALFSAVILMEIVLRLIKPITHIYYPAGRSFEAIYIPDDNYVFGLKPDTVYKHYSYYGDFVATYRINSDGLRGDRNYGYKKTAGIKRVLILGDSFAFGRGVENDQTCAAILEKTLNGGGEKFEVLNSGTLGYSPDNEYVYLREKGLLFDPDAVILTVFPRNDIMDMRYHDWTTDEQGLPIKITDRFYAINNANHLIDISKGAKDLNVPPIKAFMRNNSYVYTFLSEHRYYIKYEWKWLKSCFRVSDRPKTGGEGPQPFQMEKATVEEKDMIERMCKLLLAIKEICYENKKKFLMVLIPDSIYDKFVREFAEANGINIVDIAYHMEKDGVKNICLPKDMHWSKSGNAYVAGLIYKELLNEKF